MKVNYALMYAFPPVSNAGVITEFAFGDRENACQQNLILCELINNLKNIRFIDDLLNTYLTIISIEAGSDGEQL
ncbi:hypothetical protein ACMU59_001975 [Yersinia enterocolitica]